MTLKSGWNWIGFPSDTPLPIEEALSGLTPHNGDMIKNMSGASKFTGGSWQGTLETLEPGCGYMYNNKGAQITFTYPEARSKKKKIIKTIKSLSLHYPKHGII